MISERTRDKLSAARRKGRWIGGHVPLGYDLAEKGDALVVNPDEAACVREIFRLYLQHGSLILTVQDLNNRGWRMKEWGTRRGKASHPPYERRDSRKSPSRPRLWSRCVQMSKTNNNPLYAADGRWLGFCNAEASRHLLTAGHVTSSYGRKGHLKAIWLRSENGSSAIQGNLPGGTKYSFREQLDNGRCWSLKKLDRRDENGFMVNVRGMFLNVVTECLAQ
jgi:hypothetical protein